MNRKDAELTVESALLDAVASTADKTGLRASPETEIMIAAIKDRLRTHREAVRAWLFGEENPDA